MRGGAELFVEAATKKRTPESGGVATADAAPSGCAPPKAGSERGISRLRAPACEQVERAGLEPATPSLQSQVGVIPGRAAPTRNDPD